MPGTELEHLSTYNQARLFRAWYPYLKTVTMDRPAVVRGYAS